VICLQSLETYRGVSFDVWERGSDEPASQTVCFNRQFLVGFCEADSVLRYASFSLMQPFDPERGRHNDSYITHSELMIPDQAMAAWQVIACSNVKLNNQQVGLSRRQRRRVGIREPWFFEYKTVEFVTRKGGAWDAPQEKGPPMAFHAVRPHVKVYTERRPLFGRFQL